MRAYGCIWDTSQLNFDFLVGNKHVIYCVAMAFFNRSNCKYVNNSSRPTIFDCFEKLFVYFKILIDIFTEHV